MAAYGLLALAVAVASSAPSQGAETVSLLAAARTDGSARYILDGRAAPTPSPAATELLFHSGEHVWATDGKEQHQARVVADCPAGSTTVSIEWGTRGDRRSRLAGLRRHAGAAAPKAATPGD